MEGCSKEGLGKNVTLLGATCAVDIGRVAVAVAEVEGRVTSIVLNNEVVCTTKAWGASNRVTNLDSPVIVSAGSGAGERVEHGLAIEFVEGVANVHAEDNLGVIGGSRLVQQRANILGNLGATIREAHGKLADTLIREAPVVNQSQRAGLMARRTARPTMRRNASPMAMGRTPGLPGLARASSLPPPIVGRR